MENLVNSEKLLDIHQVKDNSDRSLTNGKKRATTIESIAKKKNLSEEVSRVHNRIVEVLGFLIMVTVIKNMI